MIWKRIDSEVVICAPASRMRWWWSTSLRQLYRENVWKGEEANLDGDADFVAVAARDAVGEDVDVDVALDQVEGCLQYADMALYHRN